MVHPMIIGNGDTPFRQPHTGPAAWLNLHDREDAQGVTATLGVPKAQGAQGRASILGLAADSCHLRLSCAAKLEAASGQVLTCRRRARRKPGGNFSEHLRIRRIGPANQSSI
jgi:hypothetical protein